MNAKLLSMSGASIEVLLGSLNFVLWICHQNVNMFFHYLND